MIVLRHSRVTFPIKVIFLAALSLYFLSMFISILVNRDFILPEALVMILLTMMFLFKMRRSLLISMTASALISLPALLLQVDTLNETGATLVRVYTVALIFLPETNKTMLDYGLPAFALLLLIALSRTAIAVFIAVTNMQLIHINFRQKSDRQKKRFFITLGIVLAGIKIGRASCRERVEIEEW